MAQSRPRCIGMEVHKETIAVAYAVQAQGAEVPSMGTMGTRPCDLDQLIRTRHSQAQHLRVVYEAGPCGYWRSRSLTHKD